MAEKKKSCGCGCIPENQKNFTTIVPTKKAKTGKKGLKKTKLSLENS